MTEAGGQTASSQPSDRLVTARSARAIADMSAANCREIWKMVGPEGLEPPTNPL